MKRVWMYYGLTILLSIFLLSACELFIPSNDIEDTEAADPGDFIVDLQHISLNAAELGTVVGRPVELTVTKTPYFHTPERGILQWESSNTDVAIVNETTGEISIVPEFVTEPMKTIIRVQSVYDPSIYATCALTLYPAYPNSRKWNFSSDFPSGDFDAGSGGTIQQATGGGAGYENGDKGPGLYIINPENPYEFGITPNGAARSGLVFNDGSYTSTVFYRAPAGMYNNADYPEEAPASAGHLRTGGVSRFFRIAALQGPFTVIVNYMSNGTAGAHADIRIGDREGIRMEGEGSQSATDPKMLIYEHKEASFVPVVFIESSTGLRVYDIYVLGNPESAAYEPVQSVSINGSDEVTAEQSILLSSAVTPPNVSSPVYLWEIISGETCAEITGSINTSSVTLKGLSEGIVTIKVTVSTFDPENPENTASQEAQTDITVKAALSAEFEEYIWSAAVDMPAETTIALINNVAQEIKGQYWQRLATPNGTTAINVNSSGLEFAVSGSRLAIGTGEITNLDRTNSTVHVPGTLNLSKKATLAIDYINLDGNLFQVFVNNNETSNANSVLGSASRIFNGGTGGSNTIVSASGTLTLTINPNTFGNHASLKTAFIQLRSGDGSNPTTLTITGIRITYDE